MEPGLYKADFDTQIGSGAGVVSIEGEVARGGDSSFWWSGSFHSADGHARGSLEVRQHSSVVEPVFGPIGRFTLDFTGEDHGANAVLHGTSPEVPGVNIRIRLNQLQAY